MSRHLSPLRLWVACVVLLVANAAMSACGPVDGECGGETRCTTTTTAGGGS